mmetsp:Transcript_19946/g.29546  ORF Transcript_19946/g.29546 Transcript_19946/m.29546 type:complete len:393 (-) Transcript_19946:193-1371(-)
MSTSVYPTKPSTMVKLRSKIFSPPASVTQTPILTAGVLVFVIAHVWSPLILFVAYAASQIVPHCFRTTDAATERRKRYAQFIQDPDVPYSLRTLPAFVHVEERYWVNSRGMALLSTILRPKGQAPKGLIVFAHGYGDHFSFVKRHYFARFVREGFAVAGLEIEGHGRSDGSSILFSDWNLVVRDVVDHIKDVKANKNFAPNLKVFLVGESMGGAVSFCAYEKIPTIISGVMFVAPMCKIKKDMLPPQWVIEFLRRLIGAPGTDSTLGYLPVSPSRDLKDVTHRCKEKHELAMACPLLFERSPRLTTARELLEATSYISDNLRNFDAPFLVQHGKADRVTDPKLSQALYDEAMSTDKTIKLYDDMWHTLTTGEPDESQELVFQDQLAWVMGRL